MVMQYCENIWFSKIDLMRVNFRYSLFLLLFSLFLSQKFPNVAKNSTLGGINLEIYYYNQFHPNAILICLTLIFEVLLYISYVFLSYVIYKLLDHKSLSLVDIWAKLHLSEFIDVRNVTQIIFLKKKCQVYFDVLEK